MEIAPCEELYSHPLHPYTRALLSAVPIADPKVDKDRERIEMLGEVPSVMNRPAGCPFSNRCRYATERCRTETSPYAQRWRRPQHCLLPGLVIP